MDSRFKISPVSSTMYLAFGVYGFKITKMIQGYWIQDSRCPQTLDASCKELGKF